MMNYKKYTRQYFMPPERCMDWQCSNRLSYMYVAGTAAAAAGEMVCTDLGENTLIQERTESVSENNKKSE